MNNHGGKREGAGRPRTAAGIARDNKIVERKLKLSAEEGWEVLAESYPNLMRVAVASAIGEAEDGKKAQPNITILRTLLELMVKVAGSEPDQSETAIKQLVGRFIDRARETQLDDGSALDSDGGGRDERPDGGHDPWSQARTTLPRVEDSF